MSSMRIKYHNRDGEPAMLDLSEKALTIGRSPDADIVLFDERASRMHAGIRLWDGEYYVKDLQSKNGTFLNNERVEMSKIKPGDKIRIGTSVLVVDDANAPGADTLMHNVEEAVEGGKGYDTILKEIVEDVEEPVEEVPPKEKKASPPAPKKKPLVIKKAGAEKGTSEKDEEKSEKPKLVLDTSSSDEEKPKKPVTKIKTRRPTQIKIKRKGDG